MAGELQAQHVSGATLYATILNAAGAVWNGAAFDATPTGAEWSGYAVTMTEDGTTGYYRGDMPAVGSGLFNVRIHKRIGGSPATTDPVVWSDVYDTRLAYLDNLSGGAVALASMLTAVKAKTDALPSDPADQSAVEAAITAAQAALAALVSALNDIAAADVWTALDDASANKIADHVLRRSWATAAGSADGDALAFRSLLGAVAKLVNRVGISGATLTVYEDDDLTALGTQAVTSDANADPITGVNTV